MNLDKLLKRGLVQIDMVFQPYECSEQIRIHYDYPSQRWQVDRGDTFSGYFENSWFTLARIKCIISLIQQGKSLDKIDRVIGYHQPELLGHEGR